jgi:hypothetical protein
MVVIRINNLPAPATRQQLDMFWNFYLAKCHTIVNNSKTTKAREIIRTNLELFEW